MADAQQVQAPAEPTPVEKPKDDGVIRLSQREYENAIVNGKVSTPEDEAYMVRLLSKDNVEIVDGDSEPPADPKPPEEPKEPETPGEPKEPPKEPTAEPEKKPDDPQPGEPNPLEKLSQQTNSWLKDGEGTPLTPEAKNPFQEELDRVKKELDELKKGKPADPASPAQTPEEKSKFKEIQKLRDDIARTPLDEKVANDEKYLKKVEQLNELLIEQVEDTTKSFDRYRDLVKDEIRAATEDVRKEMQEDRDKSQKERETEKAQEKINNSLKEISDFQSEYDTFKTSRDIKTLDGDFVNWGSRLFTLATGRQPSSINDVKSAVAAFKQNQNGLQEKATAANINEPAEMTTYMEIMDLWRIKDTLPPVNGKKPTYEDALKYKMNVTGEMDEAFLKGKKAAVEAYKNASASKPETAKTLPPETAGASAEDVGVEMTEDQAKKIVAEINVVQAYKDPKLKDQWKKAMTRLGLDPSNFGI